MKRFISAAAISLLFWINGCSAPASPPALPTQVATIALPTETITPTRAVPTRAVSTPDLALLEGSSEIWIANPGDRTVLRIDLTSGEVAASIPVDGEPALAAAGEGAVWVLDRKNDLVFRIDPLKNRVVASIPLPAGNAETLAVGAGAVWVGMTGDIDLSAQIPGQEEEILPPGRVLKIDPDDHQILAEMPVQPISRLAVSQTSLWVLSHGVIDTPLQIYDLETGQGAAVSLRNGPAWLPIEAFTVSGEDLWLFSAAYARIFHATTDGLIYGEVPIRQNRPTGYADILMARSGLWAATPWGSLLHIDPVTYTVLAEIDLHTPLSGLAAGAGAVWAVSQQTGQLFRVDPARDEITGQISTGSALEPTVVPTPTARLVIWRPCPDGPTSRIKVGDIAYVAKDPPIPNRVREEPNRKAAVQGLVNPGGSMTVIDGPACADGWVWWKIKTASFEGWMSEGDADTYWMIPLYK